MAKINEHISVIRHLIKNHTDDSVYGDEFLYELLKTTRALLIERENKKFNKISDLHYQKFCMAFDLVKYNDCSCLPVDSKCYVRKSRYKIPGVMLGRNKQMLYITTVSGKPIYYLDNVSDYEDLKYTRVKKNELFFSIENQHIIIINNTIQPVHMIKGIFEDPEELSSLLTCDDNGNDEETTCFNVKLDDFPIKQSLHIPMYQETLKLLSLPLEIPEDLTNDAKSDV